MIKYAQVRGFLDSAGEGMVGGFLLGGWICGLHRARSRSSLLLLQPVPNITAPAGLPDSDSGNEVHRDFVI
jgi:hypothetical protein